MIFLASRLTVHDKLSFDLESDDLESEGILPNDLKPTMNEIKPVISYLDF